MRHRASQGLSVILAALLLAPGLAAAAEAAVRFERLYGELLARYWHPPVRIHGIRTTVFDYARMAREAGAPGSPFERAVAALAEVDPAALDGDAAKALWINAYNLGAMQLAVEHYPVDSIRSLKISLLKYPWSQEMVHVGGRRYSLKQIEHEILLQRFEDPRIVFAVSCAAVSCPDRVPEAFTAGRVDAQIDAMIEAFLANPHKGLRLDRAAGVLTLSWILDKDRHLFGDDEAGILGFVRPYLERDTRDWLDAHSVRIRFFEHDWALNDLALADREAMP